jgi:hypothetical protein
MCEYILVIRVVGFLHGDPFTDIPNIHIKSGLLKVIFNQTKRKLKMKNLVTAFVGALALLGASTAFADETITATLVITLSRGDSVYTQMNGVYTCHRGFEIGIPKSLELKVPKGQYVQVFSSDGCYTSLVITGVTLNEDEQIIQLDL